MADQDKSKRNDKDIYPDSSNDDNDPASNDNDSHSDANVADRASQNDENQVDADELDNELNPSPEEVNEGNGVSQEDTGEYSPSGSTQFDADTRSMTTEAPDDNNDNNDKDNGLDLESDDLGGLGDPIDSNLTLIKQHLDQNHQALIDLDTDRSDAIDKMRDILLVNNKLEQRLYHLVDQLEYSSADYSKIKDRLINTEDKEKLSKYIDELSPLFKVTDKKQMNTFIDAFHRIINIEKNGSLSNLIELADYYNDYFKKDNNDKDSTESKDNDSNDGKDDEDDSSSGNDKDDNSTDPQ